MPKTLTRFLLRLRNADREARDLAKARLKQRDALPGDAELVVSPSPFEDPHTKGKFITPHDLRRTGRTKLTGELGIDDGTAERVLNHSYGSRQANAYDWNAYVPQKRAALAAWADELGRIVHGDPEGDSAAQSKVVPIRRAQPGAA